MSEGIIRRCDLDGCGNETKVPIPLTTRLEPDKRWRTVEVMGHGGAMPFVRHFCGARHEALFVVRSLSDYADLEIVEQVARQAVGERRDDPRLDPER